MKIGFLGGSFDPVHYGHLILAEQLINEAELDKVVFIPMYKSPNESHEMKASSSTRRFLLNLACCGNDKLEVSDIDLNAMTVRYMDEDMEYFSEKYPNDDLYIITGQDTFMRIEKWRNYESLLSKYKFLIGKRPGESTKELFAFFKELLSTHKGVQAEFFDIPEIAISSYEIQNKIKVGKSVKYLLPDICLDYILQNRLYGSLIPAMKKFVKARVKPHRYKHTEGVADTARRLAIRYGVDVEKAEIAAWFHDAFRDAGNLEHGPVAADKIQELFEVKDPEIINAICNHTTGRPGMSMLDKVIYVADSLEPNRNYDGVEELRKNMYVDLDKCMYDIMVHTRDYVLSIGGHFSPLTDEAIAEYEERFKENGN